MTSETLQFVCTVVSPISVPSVCWIMGKENTALISALPCGLKSSPSAGKSTLWEEGFKHHIPCLTCALWLSNLPVSVHKPKSYLWRLGKQLGKGLSISTIIFITEDGSTNSHPLHSLSLLTTVLLSMSISGCLCCTAVGYLSQGDLAECSQGPWRDFLLQLELPK